MRRRLPSYGISLLLVFLVGLLGSACGVSTGSTSTGSATATAAATATIPPTATPLATIPAATAITQVCGQYMPTPAVSVGGLAVAQQTTLGNLAYPRVKLPNNAAQAPMIVTQGNQGGFVPGPDTTHPTNPIMHEGGGYVIWVCNLSSAPHTISRVDVRLESVVSYTAQLNEWYDCLFPYTRQSGAGGGGCGGADFENEYLHAPFTPDATPGTVVTATQTGTNVGEDGVTNYGPLPVTLKHGEWMTIEVDMGPNSGDPVFSTAGTYTFSFGLSIDKQAPIFTTTSPPTLLATPAHEWNGEACTTAAMQAQIPATDTTTMYICPHV